MNTFFKYALILQSTLLIGFSFEAIGQRTTNDSVPVSKIDTAHYWGEESSKFPALNDVGLSISVNGLINNIIPGKADQIQGIDLIKLRYATKKNLAWTFGLGVSIQALKGNKTDSLSGALQTADSSYSNNQFALSLGLEKHYFASNALDVYLGTALRFGVIGRTKSTSNTVLKDTIGTNKIEITTETPGGASFGLGVYTGFNYFIAKRLSLGTEFGLNYMYSSYGGDWVRVSIETPVSGSQIINRTVGSEITKTNGFSPIFNGTVTLSYFFNPRE